MIEAIPVAAFQDNYIWLIHNPSQQTVAIVDPGDAGPVIDTLEKRNLRPVAILITHHHGDHYKPDTLSAIVGDNTQIIANPAVQAKMPAELRSKSTEVGNGGSSKFKELGIEAIPAYNTTEGRLKFHPKGRQWLCAELQRLPCLHFW